VTPEQAIAVACAAFGADPAGATVLRAADAITVQLDEARVARVIPAADADARRVLAAIDALGGHILQPLGEPVAVDEALVVPYARITPDGDRHRDLGMAGACLAGLHARGRAALEQGAIDLPAFAPHLIAERWLDRAGAVFTRDERVRLLEAIDAAWPEVTGPQTVIHGDAHIANWWPAEMAWWVLIDPEFLSIGPAVYDLAPLEVVERRLGTAPSRFPSFLAGYESNGGVVDRRALAAAINVRELLSVAWLASRAGDDSARALQARRRLLDALERREGSWLA
jgi:hypothetical protein